VEIEKDINANGKFKFGSVSGIAFVHFIHDIYTSLLAPVLPLIIQKLSLSMTLAGSLSIFMQLPSIFNPLLGSFADKRGWTRLLMVLSPGVTAILMCLIGLAPSYAALVLILFVAGISTAALHISAPVMAAQLAGNRVGRGMGFFMLGGELARTAGPVVAVWAVSSFGLEGMWQLIPPGVLASLLLWWRLKPEVDGQAKSGNGGDFRLMFKKMRRIIFGIFGILMARAFMASAIATFLPTFLYGEGHSLWFAGISLSVYEFAGAFGVIASGSISDLVGRRRVLLGAMTISPVMMVLLLLCDNAFIIPILLGLGVTTLATGPVLMAVMMENAGEHKTTANGLYMAISFAMRSLILLLIGALADTYGMRTAFSVCAGMALLGLPFLVFLPKSEKSR